MEITINGGDNPQPTGSVNVFFQSLFDPMFVDPLYTAKSVFLLNANLGVRILFSRRLKSSKHISPREC